MSVQDLSSPAQGRIQGDRADYDTIAEVSDLVVRFGDHAAVDGLTFDVRRGEIFGFLGPNGAGKTTTIRSITTIQRPTSGRITIDGFDSSNDYLEARKRIGIAQQHISLDKDLTVRQNIKQHALLHKIPKSELDSRVEYASDLLGLQEYLDHKVENLSGGWKRKASIVCAIVHRPDLLLLDEPTAGLDTRARHILWDLVRELNHRGTTIFLTTHYMDEAESLCDRVAIINHGKMVAMGTIDELRDTIGRVAVEVSSGGRSIIRYFRSREEAKEYAGTLGDEYVNIRRTTLEDVFLELTGEDRGRLS
ncbi:ABC transporter ATP-binding protein [Candidatus Methanoprimaticola sp. MG2]|uniref:ABC transporter ATP-binding protein n=1 Tax=Candidatus Methanoprimaticola sp. MG2 TaxID=3228838 RepID=UPI0039C65A80